MIAKNLKTRIITATALMVLLLLLLLFSHHHAELKPVTVVIALISVLLAAAEFCRFSKTGQVVHRCLYLLIIAVVPVTAFVSGLKNLSGGSDPQLVVKLFVIVVISAFVAVLMTVLFLIISCSQTLGMAISAAQELFIANILIGCGGGALVMLTLLHNASLVIAWLILTVSLNDMAAYFGGKRLQGPRLAPGISPNKTVSGSICGLTVGILAGMAACGLLEDLQSWQEAALLSASVVLAAQCGDILESFLKRLHGVKESGRLLPGHGGILDRIDGILLAAPALLLWLILEKV